MSAVWRHGNRQPRNLYRGDQVVGLVDSVEIADEIITAMNAQPAPDGADPDMVAAQSWDAPERAAAVEFPDERPEPLFTAGDVAHARAEGRREADNAITWGTTCLGCADQLDALIAERHAGAQETAEAIVAELQAHFDRTGEPGVREAAAVVRAYIARGFQRFTETTERTSEGDSKGVPF